MLVMASGCFRTRDYCRPEGRGREERTQGTATADCTAFSQFDDNPWLE